LRIDLYLKLVGQAKTRMAAKRLCDTGKVLLGGRTVKPSLDLQGGETLDLLFPFREVKLLVVEIPSSKSVAKSDRAKYSSILSNKEV
jgi:ribosomal 50S subunit-recycling heat shock protein